MAPMPYNRYIYQFAGIVLDVKAQRPQLKAPQIKTPTLLLVIGVGPRREVLRRGKWANYG